MKLKSKSYRKKEHTEFDVKDALEVLRKDNPDIKILKHHFIKSNNYYIKHEMYWIGKIKDGNKKFICVTVFNIKNKEIYWRTMREIEYPFYFRCPESFFNDVKSDNAVSEEWRKQCLNSK